MWRILAVVVQIGDAVTIVVDDRRLSGGRGLHCVRLADRVGRRSLRWCKIRVGWRDRGLPVPALGRSHGTRHEEHKNEYRREGIESGQTG